MFFSQRFFDGWKVWNDWSRKKNYLCRAANSTTEPTRVCVWKTITEAVTNILLVSFLNASGNGLGMQFDVRVLGRCLFLWKFHSFKNIAPLHALFPLKSNMHHQEDNFHQYYFIFLWSVDISFTSSVFLFIHFPLLVSKTIHRHYYFHKVFI